jgi:hypothetical protein
LALPNTTCGGFKADYNHQYRGPPAGRGGSFNRDSSFTIVQDLVLAYGSPTSYNPASTYLPPGVPDHYHVPLDLDAPERGQDRDAYYRDLCAHPIKLTGLYDSTYDPTAQYPMITYCDGNGQIDGEYDPDIETFPMEVALSVDLNNNGKRDYGEPVINQSSEPFDDFGSDGIPDEKEPGYDPVSNPDPNRDDYDWLNNPGGTEKNNRFDPGEHFEDVGLDGVASTSDFGEGNGVWDRNPNLEYMFSRSPRKLVEEIDQRMLSRFHLYADAGIRDFLYTAQITNQFWGALTRRTHSTQLYLDWTGLAKALQPAGGDYDPRQADFSEKTLGRHAYLRYGDPSVCPGVDAVDGRGNHVGSPSDVINRLMTAFAFTSARWPKGDHSVVDGSIADLGGKTGTIDDFVQALEFDSQALGRKMSYLVILPPDYFVHPEKRYPVIYFLHGQGQKATDLAASALFLFGPQMTSEDPMRIRARISDWQKMIIVVADGQCHPGECHTGTFYIDFLGVHGEGPKHGQAFFELMRLVDDQFRTKAPEMLPK